MQFLHVKTSLHFLHEPMFYQVKYFQNFNPIFLGFFWGGVQEWPADFLLNVSSGLKVPKGNFGLELAFTI